MSLVIVCPYSESWPDSFRAVSDALRCVFSSETVAIEHIGSTSVPGLAAKPVIDVLLGAQSLTVIESHIGKLDQMGYTYVSKYEREIPMRRYFVKSSENALRVHLHGVEHGARIW